MDRGFYLIAQKSVHQLEAGDWIVSDGEYAQVLGVNRRDTLIRAAHDKNRIYTLAGVARTTIDRIFAKEPTMKAQDLAYAVSQTLGDHIKDCDIDAIVADIFERYGRDIPNIDAVPTDEYWQIVEKHDKTAGR